DNKALAVGGVCEGMNRRHLTSQREPVEMALAPEIVPFKAAIIAGTGRGPVPVKQPQDDGGAARVERVAGREHVGQILDFARQLFGPRPLPVRYFPLPVRNIPLVAGFLALSCCFPERLLGPRPLLVRNVLLVAGLLALPCYFLERLVQGRTVH